MIKCKAIGRGLFREIDSATKTINSLVFTPNSDCISLCHFSNHKILRETKIKKERKRSNIKKKTLCL